MAQNPSQPWDPDRTWADPFIAALLLAILLLVGNMHRLRPAGPGPAADRASVQGRIQDVLQGAAQGRSLAALKAWSRPEAPDASLDGWDQAILAVHAAERGDLVRAGALIQAAPGSAGEAFRQAWTWAYRGSGAPPGPAALLEVRKALAGGYAAQILEARMLARAGGDPKPLEARARAWAMTRLAILAALGLGAVLLALAGLAFALYLGQVPVRETRWPHYGLSGRGVLIVMLGWFLTLIAASSMGAALIRLLPALRAVSIPLVYAVHALAGITYLLAAEGIGLATLRRRVAPGRYGPALAAGLGYFALAFAAVVVVALLLGPLLPGGRSPQKELLELLAHLHGAWTVLLLFLTVAVLAPIFEELMFRGFLLPWMGERLEARVGASRGRWLAIAFSGLAFGAMHMQPMGLPTLATLGIVLGFAFLRTGNLVTCILVHGLWNGGVFILMRAFS